ncbi:hypothetical protein Goklo_004475 [Gossypium klotzschianum]|uniref:Uncharacterized protein n=1 Tax=Gossypium klotzschianum TaxID=34286 RepID=A0A7J8VNY1_9ROSI|nr:hypothetical protein [Gossypium klotzschianum]
MWKLQLGPSAQNMGSCLICPSTCIKVI